jgi:predicted transcriptional regulator
MNEEGYGDLSYIDTKARIAVYDDLRSAPRIVDVEPAPTIDFIANIANKTFEFSHNQGGKIPFTVINEIAENFIHAHFKECTVSILNGGDTIRFADQGQGIAKKDLVLQPGVSSATAEMKRYIKGVGSGFPIVKEYLDFTNGYLAIDDNAVDGTVVTIAINQGLSPAETTHEPELIPAPAATPAEMLEPREQETLMLFANQSVLGPTEVSEHIGRSVATAHRVLKRLEDKGLLAEASGGKKVLSNAGSDYLRSLQR